MKDKDVWTIVFTTDKKNPVSPSTQKAIINGTEVKIEKFCFGDQSKEDININTDG